MTFFEDFAEGATELPRVMIGGLAVTLGANADKTNEFLGLTDNSKNLRSDLHNKFQEDPGSIIDAIEAHPGKFIGQIVPYAFLPLRIFGKTRHIKYAQKLRHKKAKHLRKKVVAADIGHQAATFGTYGAVEELAQSQLQDREAEPVARFVTDAALTIAMFGAFKGAVKATGHIKNKAVQSKYFQDFMIDAGMPPAQAKSFSSLSDADKLVQMKDLERASSNVKKVLFGTIHNLQVSAKLALDKTMEKGGADAAEVIKKAVVKTGLKHQEDRPIKRISAKSNIATEAKPGIERLRAVSDDVDAHARSIDRHAYDLKIQINKMMPTLAARQKISAALDINGSQIKLNPDEQAVTNVVRDTLDTMGQDLLKAGIIKSWRKEYIPHLINQVGAKKKFGDEGFFEDLLSSVGKRTRTSTFTDRALERKSIMPLAAREDAATTDIAELVQQYVLNVGRAAATKNVMAHLDDKMVTLESGGGKGFIKLNAKSHPAIVSELIKRHKLMKPEIKAFSEIIYQSTFGMSKANVHKAMEIAVPSARNKLQVRIEKAEKEINDAIPEIFKKLKAETNIMVHPDYKPSLDLLAEQVDLPTAAKAVIATNFASKRALVMGSLFHFNALSENAAFAGAGGIGAIAKGAGAGFLLTGGSPLGAAVGAGLGAGAKVLIRTKNIAANLRSGEYGDTYDFVLRYVDLRPPRDVGVDEFYNGLSAVQKSIDRVVPTNTAKGFLKSGVGAVKGINKAIDVLMWHRLMAGAKIQVFMRELERMSIKNLDLPVSQQKTQHDLALMAGQFTNDAFGGLNWRRLAENVDNKYGRRIAAGVASPKGMTAANLMMFAPDWTTANVRILAKAFPGIEKDPVARQMYQRYAGRAAMYYLIVGGAVQYALTGKHITENENPMRIDLGDGRTMTFSKQLSEPFLWASKPLHEATVKQSSLLKGIEEQVLNKQYIGGGPGTPKIVHEDDTALEAVGNRLKVAGKHLAPIFVQDIGRNGPEGVYGFFGHPVYGRIRHGFKQSNGEIGE